MGLQSEMAPSLEPRVLAAVQDIFFAAKITAAAKRAGVEVSYVRDERELLKATAPPRMIIVDLNNSSLNPIELIGKLKADPAAQQTRIIGFLSHVQGDLRREAELAGCDLVLPRSVFSQNLEDLLRGRSCYP